MSRMANGSSPLTRGAPRGGVGVERALRIIPAHAGCTVELSHTVRYTPDHPRSRGVHAVLVVGCLGAVGSSPLTRGAPEALHDPQDANRIIPAHAGCTQAPWPSSLRGRDHPRSRGVHTSWTPSPPPETGSSPLTRGAQADLAVSSDDEGIIPAHAGCTTPPPTRPRTDSDHPRSRGVHAVQRREHPEGRRIIPAHAGCTRTPGSRSRRTRDHPRSRGVH